MATERWLVCCWGRTPCESQHNTHCNPTSHTCIHTQTRACWCIHTCMFRVFYTFICATIYHTNKAIIDIVDNILNNTLILFKIWYIYIYNIYIHTSNIILWIYANCTIIIIIKPVYILYNRCFYTSSHGIHIETRLKYNWILSPWNIWKYCLIISKIY